MKHKRQDRPIRKNLALPTSIVERVDEQIRDPLTQRPPFGAWAALVQSLLVKWLNGEVKIAMPLRQIRPFCHICLLDSHLYHTCNNPECVHHKGNPHDPHPTTESQERPTPSGD